MEFLVLKVFLLINSMISSSIKPTQFKTNFTADLFEHKVTIQLTRIIIDMSTQVIAVVLFIRFEESAIQLSFFLKMILNYELNDVRSNNTCPHFIPICVQRSLSNKLQLN